MKKSPMEEKYGVKDAPAIPEASPVVSVSYVAAVDTRLVEWRDWFATNIVPHLSASLPKALVKWDELFPETKPKESM